MEMAVGIGKAKLHVPIQEGDAYIAGLVQTGEPLCSRFGRIRGAPCSGSQDGCLSQHSGRVVLHVQRLQFLRACEGGGIGRVLQIGPHQHHVARVDGKGQHGQQWN